MPINETENHPYLQIGEAIPSSKIIVGTFPIYSITNPRTEEKQRLVLKKGDMEFFYGSQYNQIWTWYKQFIDDAINPRIQESILESLRKKNIAISDVIKECSRISESSDDNGLRQIKWNNFLAARIEDSIDKILCTSKSDSGAMGWLREKILKPAGFNLLPNESSQLHSQILNTIEGSNLNVKQIAQVMSKKNKKVSLVALPSPGSPERRLVDFGYIKGFHDTGNYLQEYLSATFNWFQL